MTTLTAPKALTTQEQRAQLAATGGLQVTGLQVRFGGRVAVQDSTISAPAGQITALIGPNGAGKTTTFNACSGLNTPARGTVALHGVDLTRRGPAQRARAGLGRTYQRMELFGSLDVRTNVQLGREAGLAGARPWAHLLSTPRQKRTLTALADQALDRCGIGALAGRLPGELSTGERRMVELARAIAGGFSFLLLDEPSSGLDPKETEGFGAVLRGLVADGSVGLLVVEHDMALVMSICDYCYVLDFGKMIFEGTPAEVAASAAVKSAYLGAEEVG